MRLKNSIKNILNEYPQIVGHKYEIIESSAFIALDDCFRFLNHLGDNSIDAIVTDPPYGVKEYDLEQIEKMKQGNGGVWRMPPSFDGNTRSPLPRFTALSTKERKYLREYFYEFGQLVGKKLKPGGHIFIASNSFLSLHVFSALENEKLEFRGEVVRLVRTMRGGDRPKNFEKAFPDVCSLPRGCYEPWGLFRKPLPPKMTVGECLKEFGTGGLRRISDDKPFEDVIHDQRTPQVEKKIAKHPSLKPQKFLRKLVYSALPTGQGVIVDPFMGSGSTIAAALAVGYEAIGVEKNYEYFKLAIESIVELSSLYREPLLEKHNKSLRPTAVPLALHSGS